MINITILKLLLNMFNINIVQSEHDKFHKLLLQTQKS